MSEVTLNSLFMNGLVDKIREEIKLFHPWNLEEVMQRVIKVEKKNDIIDGKFGP